MDAYEFAALEPSINHAQMTGEAPDTNPNINGTATAEYKPHFHEWATALPGMICLSRKARNSTFRNYVAAETATPVITSCACLKSSDETQFYFAGICRSKSVRPIDDGVGPSVDEYFTLAIGGMATLLNNSKSAIFPGDYIEWTFFNEMNLSDAAGSARTSLERNKKGPRRIAVRVASSTSSRVIGRALTFAKSNETFDLLIKAA